jgi:hypothetical protein
LGRRYGVSSSVAMGFLSVVERRLSIGGGGCESLELSTGLEDGWAKVVGCWCGRVTG